MHFLEVRCSAASVQLGQVSRQAKEQRAHIKDLNAKNKELIIHNEQLRMLKPPPLPAPPPTPIPLPEGVHPITEGVRSPARSSSPPLPGAAAAPSAESFPAPPAAPPAEGMAEINSTAKEDEKVIAERRANSLEDEAEALEVVAEGRTAQAASEMQSDAAMLRAQAAEARAVVREDGPELTPNHGCG